MPVNNVNANSAASALSGEALKSASREAMKELQGDSHRGVVRQEQAIEDEAGRPQKSVLEVQQTAGVDLPPAEEPIVHEQDREQRGEHGADEEQKVLVLLQDRKSHV